MNPSFDPGQIPLRDIHLPEAVGWWPLAFGWWILGALILVAAVMLLFRYHAARRHRAACKGLQLAMDSLGAGQDPVLCAQRLSTTLRRFAMTVNDDSEHVAGLAGERWLEFLDSHWEEDAFSGEAGRRLLSAPYTAAGCLQRDQCLELGRLCVAWVNAQPVRY